MTTCTSDANANIPHINIKMLTMSSVNWWLILHVPETVLIDNNLHCFKPITSHCNSFTGNVSRMRICEYPFSLGPGSRATKRRMHAANILDRSIDCTTVLANAQPQQQVKSARCWVCSRWLWKGVGEILQQYRPIVRISHVITQNITVTKLKHLYQHRCGKKAHQNVKSHYFAVFIKMSFQLL